MRNRLLFMSALTLAAIPTLAGTALFTNPEGTSVRENVTCEAGRLTGDHGALYSRLPIYNVSHFRKANAATAAVAMTINLNAAAHVTEPTRLLTVESNHELGLIATPEGITGNWHGNCWGETVSYAKLASHPASITRDGTTYLTLTVVLSGCSGAGWNGIGGVMGYDVNGDLVINLPRLASAENKNFRSISANLDLVEILSVTPDVSRNHGEVATKAAAQAAKLERKFLKTRGEWLTPTQWTGLGIFGFIVLAGACICCFRKGKWA